MTISEIPSKRFNRRQIYDWLKSWISDESTDRLEKLLKFITGTTRIPLTKKITVSIFIIELYYINLFYYLNISLQIKHFIIILDSMV